jgi:undecaprenyl phosphate N,N'-diacetylbacillosamine 1-phosphate transferase
VSSYIKRLLDIVVSMAALVILLPLLVVIALAIKIDNPGPVFFRQERAGVRGQPFKIFKFRTMIVGAEKKGAGVFVEDNDPRITMVGNLLRKISLDELPQLINIFKGEMSLVGPRPTLPYQVENYDQRQRGRLEVKPGITGWAQVNGRSSLTWPERIELDLWYIENQSLWLDLKVLFKTVGVVLGKSNLYKPDVYDPISGQKPVKSIEKEHETNDNV